MRSSVACVRCRRSKVKCVNEGVGTTCRSCEHAGRECTYPSPGVVAPKRREGAFGSHDSATVDGGEQRHRSRRDAHALMARLAGGSRDSPWPLLDALDPRLLTPTVWQELFDTFQANYSADLPFLHPPTFLRPLRKATVQGLGYTVNTGGDLSARPPGGAGFLLAFLALTARYHPQLVVHHSPPMGSRTSNPLIASRYYAAAARQRLSVEALSESDDDIESVQALLMLGLFEWGMCKGLQAWLTIGSAVRLAQTIGLPFDAEWDDEPWSRSLALVSGADDVGAGAEANDFVRLEIRRRTWWACFAMERHLSTGKHRPHTLSIRDLRTQLPASERAYLFAEGVRTSLLGEEERLVEGRDELRRRRQGLIRNGKSAAGQPRSLSTLESVLDSRNDDANSTARLEVALDEGVISRYIRVLEIYGQVVHWACAGGRKNEQHPPWDPRSTCYQLRQRCLSFIASLPRQHQLTPQNTQAHISMKTSTPYMLLHLVYISCQLILHREYLPFVPLRCAAPEGPLDAPTFSPAQYAVPEHFWAEDARHCFRAARDVLDLLSSCRDWGTLVETPIAAFAAYLVAFFGVYCINFPWMDPDGLMGTPSVNADKFEQSRLGTEARGSGAAYKAAEILGSLRPRMHMAAGLFRTIVRTHKYFRRVKDEYRRGSTPADAGPTSPRQRRSDSNAALLERSLRDFGGADDEDEEMAEEDGQANDHGHDGCSPGHGGKSDEEGTRSDDAAVTLSRPQSDSGGGPWNAINAARTSTSTSSENVPFRSYDSHPAQSPLQQLSNFRPTYSPRDPAQSSPLLDRYSAQGRATPQTILSLSTDGASHRRTSGSAPESVALWSAAKKEVWLDGLETRLGADDLAAFVQGGEVADWVALARKHAGPDGPGWLSAVWR